MRSFIIGTVSSLLLTSAHQQFPIAAGLKEQKAEFGEGSAKKLVQLDKNIKSDIEGKMIKKEQCRMMGDMTKPGLKEEFNNIFGDFIVSKDLLVLMRVRLGYNDPIDSVEMVFAMYDENSDGKIYFEEYYNYSCTLSDDEPGVMKMLFRIFGNEEVNMNTFVKIGNKLAIEEFDLEKAFQEFDQDNDGKVTIDEFKSPSVTLTRKLVGKMLEKILIVPYSCDPNPCQNGTCSENQGKFQCVCNSGFKGKTCIDRKCTRNKDCSKEEYCDKGKLSVGGGTELCLPRKGQKEECRSSKECQIQFTCEWNWYGIRKGTCNVHRLTKILSVRV